MLKARCFLTALLALLGGYAEAAPIQIRELREILPHVRKDTLVVFDLDNTIFETSHTLGSHQWFEHYYQERARISRNSSQALMETLSLWSKVQQVSKIRPVETDTPALIRDLQRRDIPVMALTARPSEMAVLTQKQLKEVGVDFSLKPVYPSDVRKASPSAFQYIGGVIYSGSNPGKGEVLLEFLSKSSLKPKRIVFVDDKQQNVQAVSTALASTPIEHLEFRYGATDPRVRTFSSELAAVQLCLFKHRGKLVSDEEAKSLRCP